MKTATNWVVYGVIGTVSIIIVVIGTKVAATPEDCDSDCRRFPASIVCRLPTHRLLLDSDTRFNGRLKACSQPLSRVTGTPIRH